jgi:uncharacterized protein YutE (UPF0331/DUF86 family)/predicted nucleotidyltransferase
VRVRIAKDRVNVQQRLDHVTETVACWNELVALWLFGSYARQEATPLSDLDFAYLLQEGLPEAHIQRLDKELYITLAQLFSTDDLSLVDLRRAPSRIAFAVLQQGQLLFCRDPAQRAQLQESVATHFPEAEQLTKEVLRAFEHQLKGKHMAVEKERLLAQLRLLQDDLDKLREKARLSRETYLTDEDTRSVVERRFQTATESCLNIGNHLIARLNLRLAEDYASVFRSLSEGQVISVQLAEAMADMARFRNLLVHLYWTVDHQLVYDTMATRIATLDQFMREVAAYLATLDAC